MYLTSKPSDIYQEPVYSGFAGRVRGIRGIPFSIPPYTVLTLAEDYLDVVVGGRPVMRGHPDRPVMAYTHPSYYAALAPTGGGYVLTHLPGEGSYVRPVTVRNDFNLSVYSPATGWSVVPIRGTESTRTHGPDRAMIRLPEGAFVTAYSLPLLSTPASEVAVPPTAGFGAYEVETPHTWQKRADYISGAMAAESTAPSAPATAGFGVPVLSPLVRVPAGTPIYWQTVSGARYSGILAQGVSGLRQADGRIVVSTSANVDVRFHVHPGDSVWLVPSSTAGFGAHRRMAGRGFRRRSMLTAL